MPFLSPYHRLLTLIKPQGYWVLLLFAGLFFLTPNPAQSQNTPQVHVEIIIFQSLAQRGWTEEYWPLTPGLVLENNVNRLGNLETTPWATPVAAEDLQLAEERSRMTTDRGYDVLAHIAWQQPAFNRNTAQPLIIDSQLQKRRHETAPIYGQVRAYQERFNHVEIKLELDRRIPVRLRERFAEHQGIALEFLPDSWTFMIDESRRVRPGELHYVDHPLFGVLIHVSRVTQPEG
ncbi:CsiV family protein [Thiomicrospira sp. ALE5]|uniref:CsiV family protein n=1 Tax=Thiomicrospira sp. ALE5 TaxID=748650 RepID=UPI0008F31E54|nr:CsiV family protein [Thiomicrospira sp. ALE5]SFR51751.1 Peptidoglycan-binding protein, CsiV [Thiomicrospira sp. ALE5]